ncbi:hypothetical protein [Streptomyces sp. ISL-94]|uniref:hypothetical protein n=1 Tax=Streptomyces sp. ISL-94 TaxID=2819190 RepID=UPI001BE765C2|nr:hypothetical protein [Streptomyces sp. ISL-94]
MAVSAVGPSTAQPSGGAPDRRPVVGSGAAGKQSTAPVTVTLVTGDRILVSTDTAGRTAATAMPRPDGSQPLVQTRQGGNDPYIYPKRGQALAAGKADHELFNVTGLIRQGHDDAHTKTLPLIAVYDGSVSGGLDKLGLDGKVQANLERSTKQVDAPAAWAAGYDGKGTTVAVLDTGRPARSTPTQGPEDDGQLVRRGHRPGRAAGPLGPGDPRRGAAGQPDRLRPRDVGRQRPRRAAGLLR